MDGSKKLVSTLYLSEKQLAGAKWPKTMLLLLGHRLRTPMKLENLRHSTVLLFSRKTNQQPCRVISTPKHWTELALILMLSKMWPQMNGAQMRQLMDARDTKSTSGPESLLNHKPTSHTPVKVTSNPPHAQCLEHQAHQTQLSISRMEWHIRLALDICSTLT